MPLELTAFSGMAETEQPSAPDHRGGRTAVGTGDGLLGLDEEVRASVPGPAALGVLGADGPLLAVGDDGDAGGRQSLREQVVHGRSRAPLAQRQVVLIRAALVAVPLDEHEVIAPRLQPRGIGIEGLGILGADVGLVEVEVDVLEILVFGELRRPRGGSGSRRWRDRGRRRRRRGRRPGRGRGRRRRGADGNGTLRASGQQQCDGQHQDNGRSRSRRRAHCVASSQRVRVRSAGMPGRLGHLNGTHRTSCYFAKAAPEARLPPWWETGTWSTMWPPWCSAPPRGGEEQAMSYDLVIKNGWVVDGSGLPRYRGDVGVIAGRIAAIGRIRESAREVIDAEGRVVAPGFVDGHTHMDAQIFWDPLGTSSCWHGITSVVMGNCGFTLAPCAKADRHLVIRNLERAEDIAGEAMEAGIDWRWTTFPEFLDTLDSLPKGINYSGYIGHSALRTYVMGERAFEKPATEDDLRAMERELRDALRAGAMGFTTSRSPSHETPDHRPVASRVADWAEVRRLVNTMGELNAGIFEIAGENVDREADHPGLPDYHRRLKALAVESGRPITFGVFGRRGVPNVWRKYMALLDETAAEGGRMFAQAHSRSLSALLSFKTQMPFDRLPLWKELRKLPLAEKIAKLRDPEFKKKLVEATDEKPDQKALGTEARPQPYEWLFVFDTVEGPHRSVAEVAAERGVHPAQAMIDLALEKDLDLFFLMPVANEDQDNALEIMKHPRACVTFSDSGAHVTQLMDSSLQTHLLAHWVRKKHAFTLPQAVRMLTLVPATLWGFADRGLVREGMAADFVVFDPETIGAEMPELVADLPAGAKRLVQRCRGVAATVVNGETILRDGKPTGAHPGQLLRGPLARRG